MNIKEIFKRMFNISKGLIEIILGLMITIPMAILTLLFAMVGAIIPTLIYGAVCSFGIALLYLGYLDIRYNNV